MRKRVIFTILNKNLENGRVGRGTTIQSTSLQTFINGKYEEEIMFQSQKLKDKRKFHVLHLNKINNLFILSCIFYLQCLI